jgi:hypothetical protein
VDNNRAASAAGEYKRFDAWKQVDCGQHHIFYPTHGDAVDITYWSVQQMR